MCLMNIASGEIKSSGIIICPSSAQKDEFYSSCEPLKTKILANEFEKMNELDGQNIDPTDFISPEAIFRIPSATFTSFAII